jgi:alpha-tubulin suppressor-like RCC1 family protein
MMGSNSNGKLGLGDLSISEAREPNLITDTFKVDFTHVALGENHTMAITDAGDAYGWGEGLYCGLNM